MVLTTLVHLTVGMGLPVPLQYILTSWPFSASSWDLLLEWMEGGALVQRKQAVQDPFNAAGFVQLC